MVWITFVFVSRTTQKIMDLYFVQWLEMTGKPFLVELCGFFFSYTLWCVYILFIGVPQKTEMHSFLVSVVTGSIFLHYVTIQNRDRINWENVLFRLLWMHYDLPIVHVRVSLWNTKYALNISIKNYNYPSVGQGSFQRFVKPLKILRTASL